MLRKWCLIAGLLIGANLMAAEFPIAEQLPESKTPPDPLKMVDGTSVTTPDEWFKKRRPELASLVAHYMYGKPPATPENVRGEIVRTESKALGGKATLREVTVSFGPENKGKFSLLLILPNKKEGKSPLFVGLNFNGNHTVLPDPEIALTKSWMQNNNKDVTANQATDAGRGKEEHVWCADLLVDRGYGLATVYYGDIDPDRHDWTDGIHPLYYKPGQTKPADDEWGSIAAWAWGMSRIIDYVTTLEEVDSKRIAAIGHSRLGKTALLAGATDERIALVCPHQSGTGGMALSRDNDQETVKRINTVFPHWFCGNFKAFNDNEAKIPFDQHSLVALCAPRPVFDTEGLQDKWANYDNALRSLQLASPVYKLLGKSGLKVDRSIEQDEKFSSDNCGELVQYRRDDKHMLNRGYWERILDFADQCK